jgi:hypothetical protein
MAPTIVCFTLLFKNVIKQARYIGLKIITKVSSHYHGRRLAQV